jgi:hypothetical protein
MQKLLLLLFLLGVPCSGGNARAANCTGQYPVCMQTCMAKSNFAGDCARICQRKMQTCIQTGCWLHNAHGEMQKECGRSRS